MLSKLLPRTSGPSRRALRRLQPSRAVPPLPAVIIGVEPEDAQLLDELLASASFEEVQQKTQRLALAGGVTPALLDASEKLLKHAEEDKEAPAELVGSLQSVTDLLRNTLEALERLRPKSELADALVQLDVTTAAGRQQALDLMAAAFAPTTGKVDRLEFIEDLVFFTESGAEQDAAFVAAYGEGRVDLGGMSLAQAMEQRAEGRARMKSLVDLASGFAS